MDKGAFEELTKDAQVAYLNEQLATGASYDDILAAIEMTKKEIGARGIIKVGKEVRVKPGHGDSGFAW